MFGSLVGGVRDLIITDHADVNDASQGNIGISYKNKNHQNNK
jgi:hypothetical protein